MREPHWSVGPTCISESHTGLYGLHENQRATLVCMAYMKIREPHWYTQVHERATLVCRAYMHIREPHWSVGPTCISESHTGLYGLHANQRATLVYHNND